MKIFKILLVLLLSCGALHVQASSEEEPPAEGEEAAAAAKPGMPVRSGPLLPRSQPTGFEDTEMPGADSPAPDLSSTQYGELN